MKKIKFKVRVPKRRNPVALPARKCKAGPHKNRCKDYKAEKSWRDEVLD